jgi:hypothetical protein
MTDRGLLEAAAKAAWIELDGLDDHLGGLYLTDHMTVWNPLTDDGDALRLAVQLRLHLEWLPTVDGVCAWQLTNHVVENTPLASDPYAATRRAIVRAAAAIGGAVEAQTPEARVK